MVAVKAFVSRECRNVIREGRNESCLGSYLGPLLIEVAWTESLDRLGWILAHLFGCVFLTYPCTEAEPCA